MKPIVAVLGDAAAQRDSRKYRMAFELGRLLVDNGCRIQCGGLGGIMEAVCAGARTSEKYADGDTIGLIPSFDRNKANEYVDIVIPTGLDIARNALTGSADAVIALGGGAGTLSEIAIAWSLYKLIIAFKSVPGWSSKLADTIIDERPRYPHIPDDRVYGVESPQEAVELLLERLKAYDRVFEGLSGVNPRNK